MFHFSKKLDSEGGWYCMTITRTVRQCSHLTFNRAQHARHVTKRTHMVMATEKAAWHFRW